MATAPLSAGDIIRIVTELVGKVAALEQANAELLRRLTVLENRRPVVMQDRTT